MATHEQSQTLQKSSTEIIEPTLKTEASLAHHIGWYDALLNADTRFKLEDMEPSMAAQLLCEIDPTSVTAKEVVAKGIKSSVTTSDDFVRLLEHFEDVSKCHPGHRSLLRWLQIARESNLDRH